MLRHRQHHAAGKTLRTIRLLQRLVEQDLVKRLPRFGRALVFVRVENVASVHHGLLVRCTVLLSFRIGVGGFFLHVTLRLPMFALVECPLSV
jgi:hypothetical protein